MKSTGYIALSQQSALLRQMDVLANNIANGSTAAFRGERMSFAEVLATPEQGGTSVSFVRDREVTRDPREGTLTPTGNDLDVALRGPGFFVVKTDEGNRYTRDGHFHLDAAGKLVTMSGHAVTDDRGQEITIPGSPATLLIARDGSVKADKETVGRIAKVQFTNEQALEKDGTGLYATAETPEPADKAEIRQGMVEASNVQPIVEMTHMMTVLRAFQGTQNMLDGEHDRQIRAIRELAKVDQA